MIGFSQFEVANYFATRVPDLAQRGKRWRGRCPIHRGQGYNFSVNPESGLWRCWSSCGLGGDIITLEMALSGSSWREAVAVIEHAIGRVLIDRPATRTEQRSFTEARKHEQAEMREAEYFRIAAISMAETALEDLPDTAPDRYDLTQLLIVVRSSRSADLLRLYRDYLAHEPRLTAALVYAGAQAWNRLCNRLARFITEANGVSGAA
jgi:CHC2 zinc finger